MNSSFGSSTVDEIVVGELHTLRVTVKSATTIDQHHTVFYEVQASDKVWALSGDVKG